MISPRSLPPGEATGLRLLAVLSLIAIVCAVGAGAAIYGLLSWLENHR